MTGLDAAVLVITRSADLMITRFAVALLLAVFGSGVAEGTVAGLVAVPAPVLVPTAVTTVMVATPVGPRVPIGQVTTDPVTVQLPTVVVALVIVWPAGTGSVTVTDVAWDGPAL